MLVGLDRVRDNFVCFGVSLGRVLSLLCYCGSEHWLLFVNTMLGEMCSGLSPWRCVVRMEMVDARPLQLRTGHHLTLLLWNFYIQTGRLVMGGDAVLD
jgi:hypothetical protein